MSPPKPTRHGARAVAISLAVAAVALFAVGGASDITTSESATRPRCTQTQRRRRSNDPLAATS